MIVVLIIYGGLTLGLLWHEARAGLGRGGPQGEVILVLGGGINRDGSLFSDSARRVDLGVQLWQAGRAPVLVFSGGAPNHRNPPAAELMARRAVAAGVPRDAILLETDSHSTLQNGLYSERLLSARGLRRVIVVTDAFHMTRSWASLRWAGIEMVDLEASGMLQRPATLVWPMLREGLATAYNLWRVARWHIVPEPALTLDQRIKKLTELRGRAYG